MRLFSSDGEDSASSQPKGQPAVTRKLSSMVQWRSLLVFWRLGGSFDDRQGGKLSGEGLSGPDNGRLCFIRLKRQETGRQFLPRRFAQNSG